MLSWDFSYTSAKEYNFVITSSLRSLSVNLTDAPNKEKNEASVSKD